MDIKHNKYMEMMDVSISLIKLCGKCVAKPVSATSLILVHFQISGKDQT